MAHGYSAVIPLQKNEEDGFYVLTKTLAQNTQQNFKNLLLTAPGERVMIPDFGVGLRRYLFENNPDNLKTEIFINITDQTERYLPFIQLDEIEFIENPEFSEPEYSLAIRVFYSVPSLGVSDMITVTKF